MKNKFTFRFSAVVTLLLLCIGFQTKAQLTVTDNQTATQLVQALTGSGVTVLNPTMVCPAISNAKFTVTGTSNLGIDSGIIMTSGRAMTVGTTQGVNGPNIGAGPGAGTTGP